MPEPTHKSADKLSRFEAVWDKLAPYRAPAAPDSDVFSTVRRISKPLPDVAPRLRAQAEGAALPPARIALRDPDPRTIPPQSIARFRPFAGQTMNLFDDDFIG